LEIKPYGIYIDGTIGGAGHSVEIFRRLDSRGVLIGIDQDASAIEASRRRLEDLGLPARLILEKGNFKDIKNICFKHSVESVDGILLDLGVSSYQLDKMDRGFSYRQDAPLDMRMDRSNELNARRIVNEFSEKEIRDIIRNYGEERWASRIAAFIVNARKEKAIETTAQLVDIIKEAIPSAARRRGPHPAKRTFQALRIAVNDELGILDKTIGDAVSLLKAGGKLCIITFHSLEDRIVKKAFQKKALTCTCPSEYPICICKTKPEVEIITRRPITPSNTEKEENPRSRSAKLRIIRKL
jgi:16S rRNA (cytosine1402-N4)-methyltransferase